MSDEPDPAAVAEAAAAFREDHDEGERALEAVLAADAERDTWTFDELPLDSGTFGELVSRDIVTKVDGEYRIASRRGVRAGLEGEELSTDRSSSGLEFSSPIAFDARAAVGLAGALVFLFAMRVVNYRSVFRGDHVVSPANDPYHYRYWMEELLAESDGITDVGVVTSLPDGAAERRPLTHAANWFFAELLGGDQWAADMVAVWLPVVVTVVLGVVVYWLATVITDDVRVGIASVILLALTPVHAVYTGIGFLEHRLHQYFWLGVTLLTLAWLAVDLQRRHASESTPETAISDHLRCPWTWVAAVVLGVAITFSMFAWGGSILMLVPVAAYVGLKVAVDVRAGLSPLPANVPILVGLGVSGVLAAFLHFRWGWHDRFTAAVSLLVVVSAVAVAGFGELWRRLEWPAEGLVGFQVLFTGICLVALRYLYPAEWTEASERAGDLFFREGIAETTSLFAVENGIIFGPLSQFGVGFYLAVLILGWICWIVFRRYEPGWLLLAVYTAFWLVLAAIQGRFAAQLAIPLSVLGGMGLVWLVSWAGLVRAPTPFRERETADRDAETVTRGATTDGGERQPSIIVPTEPKTLVALVWIVLLICGMSLIFVPSMLAQTTHSDAQFEAAMVIDDHATSADREYPDSFVLSKWGDNRMYNYFVSGESEGYAHAIRYFGEFQTDDDPDEWYGQFNDTDVGYVVMTESTENDSTGGVQTRLHDELGTGGEEREPLEHYQVIYVDEDVTAFAVVPGATITATGEPGETVTIETEETVSNETITYEREVTVNEDGTLEVTVPYPGEYTVGDRAVDVSTAAVEDGSTVELE